MRELRLEYVYDHRIANCDACGLRPFRDETLCLSEPNAISHPCGSAVGEGSKSGEKPFNWNGLLILGEGPGNTEARLKRPFMGPSGELLTKLLTKAGLKREECYVGNTTLCRPDYAGLDTKRKSLTDAFPTAVPSCRPRLLAEIEALQPRVILAFGQAALAALTGVEETVAKRVPYTCGTCKGELRWRRWGCAKCKKIYPEFPVVDENRPSDVTTCCFAKWQPRNEVCDECKGLKTSVQTSQEFKTLHTLGEVAGGVFRAQNLPALVGILKEPDKTFVIATYHPAHLLRPAETKGDKKIGGQFLASAVLMHCRKAARLLHEDPVWSMRHQTITTAEELNAYLERWAGDVFTVDIETDNEEPLSVTKITCVGFNALSTDEVIVCDTDGLPREHPLVQAICDFWSDARYHKVGHGAVYRKAGQNILYDSTVIRHVWGAELENLHFDTMIAHIAVAPDEPHHLQHIASSFTDAEPWKPPKKAKTGGFHFDSKEELHLYNARDVRNTSLATGPLSALMVEEKTRQVHDLDIRKVEIARHMTLAGMPVDRREMLRIGADAQYERETEQREMRAMFGRLPDSVLSKAAQEDVRKGSQDAFYFNPHSTPQLQWALFDPQGPFKMPPTGFTDGGGASTDKPALMAVLSAPHAPREAKDFVQRLMRYRDAKMVTTLCNISEGEKGLQIGVDGRVHPSWYPNGARTGRWTSEPNFQNFKKWLRAMFRVGEGRRLVGADKAQLELRIMAARAGATDLIRRCKTAVESRKLEPECDPHSFIASKFFGETFTLLSLADPLHDRANKRCKCETCIRKLLREVIKRGIYGLAYGATEYTVYEALIDGGYDGPPISVEMIRAAIDLVFTTWPELRTYFDGQYALALKTGYVFDGLLGRMRCFPLGDVSQTEVFNWGVQCLPGNVRVLTAGGYIPIGEIARPVFAWTGNRWSPARRISKGAEQVWRVTTDAGHALEANAAHRLLVADGADFVWRETAALKPGDTIGLSLATPMRCGCTEETEESAFWLGYWIGNGSWTRGRNEAGMTFGTRVYGETHQEYALRFRRWLETQGLTHQKPTTGRRHDGTRSNCTIIVSSTLPAWLARFEIDDTWKSKTKRVPPPVWRWSLDLRGAYLRGYFAADGSLSARDLRGAKTPTVNTPNLELLRDTQLLLRSCGVESRIRGPYKADRAGHIMWRLNMHGRALQEFLGWAAPRSERAQLRYSTGVVCTPDAVSKFLDLYPRNPFDYGAQASFYVLWSRLAHGGNTNPHTLARMLTALDARSAMDLYATAKVASVEALEREAPMYTLMVGHSSHRYDSAGFISKNSSAATVMDSDTLRFFHGTNDLPSFRQIDPTAKVIAQVHDALYVECDERRADQMIALMNVALSCEVQLAAGEWMPLPATAHAADNWMDAA